MKRLPVIAVMASMRSGRSASRMLKLTLPPGGGPLNSMSGWMPMAPPGLSAEPGGAAPPPGGAAPPPGGAAPPPGPTASFSYRTRFRNDLPHLPASLLDYYRGRVSLAVPMVEARPLYTQREMWLYGVAQ